MAESIAKQEKKADEVKAKIEQSQTQENKLEIAAVKVAEEFTKQEQKAADVKTIIEEQISSMDKAADRAKRISQNENDIKKDTRVAADEQNRFAQAAHQSHLKLINLYAAVQLIKTGIQLAAKALTAADEYSDINARLSMINDGIMTQEQLQNSVYQAARNTKSAYSDIADTVTRIGWNAEGLFLNNKSIVNFTQLATKAVKTGSRSASDNAQAMTNVLQGLEAGGLTGYSYTSLAQSASGQAFLHYVAEGLDVSMGKLKQMTSEGELTAVVVAESLSKASESINQDFSKLPTTFNENMTKLKDIGMSRINDMNKEGGFLYEINKKISEFTLWLEGIGGQQLFQYITDAITFAGSITSPIIDTIGEQLQRLINLANNPGNQAFFQSLRTYAQRAGEIIKWVVITSVDLASNIAENWSKIEPIVWAIVAGIAAFKAVMLVATAAQWALNLASISFPAAWLVAAIAGVVAAFSVLLLRVLGTKNAVSDTIEKLNEMSGLNNKSIEFVMDDGQVMKGTVDRHSWEIETDYVPESPAAIAEINSNLMPEGLRETAFGNIIADDMEKREAENKNINNDRSYWGQYDMDQTGEMLSNIQSEMENAFRNFADPIVNNFNQDDEEFQYDWEKDKERYGFNDGSIDINRDYGSDFNLGNIGNIDSVGRIKESVDISSQDLRYLRDIAEREAINEITTNVIVPQTQVSFGDVRETADIDEICGRLKEIIEDELFALPEGAH